MLDTKTVVIILGLFFSGYYFGIKSNEASENDRRQLAQNIAEKVQEDVNKWKQNIKTVHKVEPIYLNECVTDDYRRVFNENQRMLSGKPVSKVSGK